MMIRHSITLDDYCKMFHLPYMSWKERDEAQKERVRQWQLTHKSEVLRYRIERRKKQKSELGCFKATHTKLEGYLLDAWTAKAKEHAHVYNHTYWLAHKDMFIDANRRWRCEHPEQVASQQRKYRCSHTDVIAVAQSNRRARVLGAGDILLLTAFREKCHLLNDACGYCGRRIKLEPDHMIPLVRGGSNDITNIMPACTHCNRMKYAKTPEEFATYLDIPFSSFYYQTLLNA